jgi:hypothetical protein
MTRFFLCIANVLAPLTMGLGSLGTVSSVASAAVYSPSAESILESLSRPREVCQKNEWGGALERAFEEEKAPQPFLEFHLANGFLCESPEDLRQFLLLLGEREFPARIAKRMSIERARVLAREERALRQSSFGVRIFLPQNLGECDIEVEGLQVRESEIRSLPARSLHVRYLCGNKITTHHVFISPAAVEYYLPKIESSLEEAGDKAKVAEVAAGAAIEHKGLSERAQSCRTGIALLMGDEEFGMRGVNNTRYPVVVAARCETARWKVSALFGEVEFSNLVGSRVNREPRVFVAGNVMRRLGGVKISSVRLEAAAGAGFWAGAKLDAPLEVHLEAQKKWRSWLFSASVGVGAPVHNPSHKMWVWGIGAGYAP